MKQGFSVAVFIAGLVLASGGQAAAERIGTYDSRAIAVAYAGSPVQQKFMAPLRAAHQAAKRSGNRAEVEKFEAQGRALQQRAHRQAFSTAPVDDLLEQIAEALPEIRRGADVTALVSIWDADGLARHAGAARVDVTAALVDAFQPTARQRKTVEEIRKQKPLPLDKVIGSN